MRAARTRLPALVLALAAGSLAALAGLAPSSGPLASLARADDGEEDKLAPIRDEVVKLEKEGRFESALALLRGVKEETLDPGSQLERAQRIDTLTTKQLEKYADDRTRAAALEKAGKAADAAKALAGVDLYGNAKQKAEAKVDQARLEELAKGAAAKSAEEGKKKAAEDAKQKAANTAADRGDATKAVKKWLDARRQLLCSACGGAKILTCKSCDGGGKIKVIPVGGVSGSGWENCARCKAEGKVKCGADSCKGSGVNGFKARAVCYDVLPKAYRAELEKKGLNEKRFVDALRALLLGEDTPVEVEACAAAVEGMLEPIKSYDTFELQIGEDGTATAKYFVKRGLKPGGMEESRWGKYDGAWCLVPPADAPPRKKKPGKPKGEPEADGSAPETEGEKPEKGEKGE